ncbi:MAG TPA: outer membrane beta-barrel protein [Chitinophagaceae bacterium]|nr:outer membrane beta-barrel protein [Chitinophagaceae bacterium]
MKKLFLIAGITLGLSASAQTEKGSWMVGGNIGGLNLGFGKSITNFSIAVNPIGLYFITDNLGIGGRALLGVDNTSGGGTSVSTFKFGIAPTLRYYFTEMGKGKIFGEAAVDLEGSSTSGTSTTTTGFSIGAGYNYFFNPHVALEAGLRYADKNRPYNAPTAAAGLDNINVNFGLQIFFPKKTVSHVKSSYRKK